MNCIILPEGCNDYFQKERENDLEQSYSKWARTVEGAPDVINMTFIFIVSLCEGVAGIKSSVRIQTFVIMPLV